jgi:hypothetical protein
MWKLLGIMFEGTEKLTMTSKPEKNIFQNTYFNRNQLFIIVVFTIKTIEDLLDFTKYFLIFCNKYHKTHTKRSKINKSRVLPHILFYRNVCLTLKRTQNYNCYAQSFYWLHIYPVTN